MFASHLGGGPVRQLLHPGDERIPIGHLVPRIGVEGLECAVHTSSRRDHLGQRLLFGNNGIEQVHAPRVRVVDVDVGTDELR